MLIFNNTKISHDPYPVGTAKNILPHDLYNLMVDRFPSEKIFHYLGGDKSGYNKYSLSERNNPGEYKEFVRSDWLWLGFYSYIKSVYFVNQVISVLIEKGIKFPKGGTYSSRFEFSSLPADGGFIRAHTDIPSKIITLVVGMDKVGSWNNSWGGGTDILCPKDPTKHLVDYNAELTEFNKVNTLEHEPNEAVIFVKTNNSWHSVGPIQGPKGVMRRTLTINIERA